MGADLNNIVKCQALSDEHVQFLVYQLLRGLKVGGVGGRGSGCAGRGVPVGWAGPGVGGARAARGGACPRGRREPDLRSPPSQYIHSAGIIHRVGGSAGPPAPLLLRSAR